MKYVKRFNDFILNEGSGVTINVIDEPYAPSKKDLMVLGKNTKRISMGQDIEIFEEMSPLQVAEYLMENAIPCRLTGSPLTDAENVITVIASQFRKFFDLELDTSRATLTREYSHFVDGKFQSQGKMENGEYPNRITVPFMGCVPPSAEGGNSNEGGVIFELSYETVNLEGYIETDGEEPYAIIVEVTVHLPGRGEEVYNNIMDDEFLEGQAEWYGYGK